MRIFQRSKRSTASDTAIGSSRSAADRAPGGPGGRRWYRSPLMRRLLAVNLLALIVLAASLLYLGGYKRELIETELRLATSKAEAIATALGHDSVRILADGEPALNLRNAEPLLRRLIDDPQQRVAIRVRIFGPDGALRLDSRRFADFDSAVESRPLPETGAPGLLADALDLALGLLDRAFRQPETAGRYREQAEQTAADYPEVEAALEGRTGQVVRSLGRGGLMLSVAAPVRNFKRVVGAALVSAEGHAIDRAVRDIRLDILATAAAALLVTALLSAYLARGIARPLRMLAAAAERVRPDGGRADIPDLSRRRDEIGDLSAALRRMTEALWARMDATEKFAADVSHEIKNPLASVHSAIETAMGQDDPAVQRALMQMVLDDVRRLDRLIDDIADASGLDAQFARAESGPVDLARMLQTLVEIEPAPRPELLLEEAGPIPVHGVADQLARVVRNLVDNARSFSPEGVRLSLCRRGDEAVLRVEDDGPGIPAGSEERIFERFYTDREEGCGRAERHSGLGLSISREIARLHGGAISACNRRTPDGAVLGARFELRLPVARP